MGSALGGWLAAIDFTLTFLVAGALVVSGAGLVLALRGVRTGPAGRAVGS